MPKKIRRSNNRLRKTNRKGHKTANCNRLRKFGGGGNLHWIGRADGYYYIKDMKVCKDHIDSLIKSGTKVRDLFYKLYLFIFKKKSHLYDLPELSDYLSVTIDLYTRWEEEHRNEQGRVEEPRRSTQTSDFSTPGVVYMESH